MGKELYFIDLSDLVHPQLIATLDLKAHSSPQVPALYGDYLCIPACTEFFLVYIGESTRPGVIVSMELPDTTDRLILQDHLLYMNSSQRGLLVINLSDPQNPLKLPGFRLPGDSIKSFGSVKDLAVQGNLVYTVHTFNPLQIWDVSNPMEVKKRGGIASSTPRETITSPSANKRLPGRLAIILTWEAMDMLSLGKEGSIATFGIPFLDDLNRKYGVFEIVPPDHSKPPTSQYDRTYRRYIIEFPESVDLDQIQGEFEVNAYCVLSEFEYRKESYTSESTLSYQTGSFFPPPSNIFFAPPPQYLASMPYMSNRIGIVGFSGIPEKSGLITQPLGDYKQDFPAPGFGFIYIPPFSVNYLTLGRATVPGYTLPIRGYSDFIPVPRFGYGAFLPEP